MADNDATMLPPPSPEHRRIAASQFERANQVIATGNYDYGIRLLMSCCKLDAANLIYRQALRRTEKTKYRNNLRGSWLASVTTIPVRARLKAAKSGRDWLRVLEFGEAVLAHNPWDTGAQMDMAEAADALGLLDLAIWTLEQARQKNPREAALNRSLARLYEKRGNFTQAIALWELVRKAAPGDVEAQGKAKDLAASETIARGNYAGAGGCGPTARPTCRPHRQKQALPRLPGPAPRCRPSRGRPRRRRIGTAVRSPGCEAASRPIRPTPTPTSSSPPTSAASARSTRPAKCSSRASGRPASTSSSRWR